MRKETDASKLYLHQAASHKEDPKSKLLESKILAAISLNNLTVLKLKEGKDLRTALKIAKNALDLIEGDILKEIKNQSTESLTKKTEFLQNLQVLLITYFNLGMCQGKLGIKSINTL